MFDDIEPYPSARIRRYKLPDREIPKDAAYQIISDELMLDGNPRLNLASFVTTWMEPECDKLIMDSLNKNYIDMDEYPITTELQVSYHANSFGALAPCSMSLSNKYSYRSTKQLSLILCINLELCAGLQCLQRDSVRSLLYIGDYPSDSSFC